MIKQTIKALIIEDSLEDRELYQRYLNKLFDCTLVEVEFASEGINELEKQDFDIVFLDYHLPDMTGLECLTCIKDKSCINCPIVILTGQGNEEIAANFIKLGASDYIVKNKISLDSLSRVTTNAIEKYKYEQLAFEKQRELYNFAHTISHDLRAPIGRIQSYVTLLASKLAALEKTDTLFLKYINNIQQDTLFCINFISSLIKYAELGRTSIVLSLLNLNEIVNKSIANLELEIDHKRAQVTVLGPLPYVKGEIIALTQLFQNLISNAIKYSDSTPIIKIYTTHNVNHVTICVEDNGIGIPEEHIQDIFKPFTRLENSLETQGFGLGLALCKIIANQHSATINVKSKQHQGTTFSIDFPIIYSSRLS